MVKITINFVQKHVLSLVATKILPQFTYIKKILNDCTHIRTNILGLRVILNIKKYLFNEFKITIIMH